MVNNPHYLGHRKRLRKRFKEAGSKGFHDYELLELLLTFSIPRRDVKPIAKELIKRFGNLSGVLNAGYSDLIMINGIGEVSTLFIRLIKEIQDHILFEAAQKRDLLSSPKSVVDFSKSKLSSSNEKFMVLYLNPKNELIEYLLISEGTVDNVAVYPRKIVEGAISMHASSIILVHNHPSGHVEPSDEDKQITGEIIKACKHLDIRVLDHIIVGSSDHYSFSENGIMKYS